MARRAKRDGADVAMGRTKRTTRGPGRPKKERPATEAFTSADLKKFVQEYGPRKRKSEDTNAHLSELFKAAIDKGAPRQGLRWLVQLHKKSHGEATALLTWLSWAYDLTADKSQMELGEDGEGDAPGFSGGVDLESAEAQGLA